MALGTSWPALHLFPIGDTFTPKQIILQPSTKIKIGRQTNAKTAPSRTNGYFDSKVLSRMHAEIWYEDGKIFIRDTKSSNGTFVNGERLSLEGVDSDPFGLQSNDVVEFGIDIVGDDNKTILHHKVAARVRLVLSADDAAFSAKELEISQREREAYAQHSRRAGSSTQTKGSNGMGLDGILSRLKNELQKSRETSKELSRISNDMNEIGETLDGTRFPNPEALKRQQSTRYVAREESIAKATNQLKTDLQQAQTGLNYSMERIQSIETIIEDQQLIRRDVEEMRSEVREAQIDLIRLRQDRAKTIHSSDSGSELTLRDSDDLLPAHRVNGTPLKLIGSHPNIQGSPPGGATELHSLQAKVEALALQLNESQKENLIMREESKMAMTHLTALQDRFRALERSSRGLGTTPEDLEAEAEIKQEDSPSSAFEKMMPGENGHAQRATRDNVGGRERSTLTRRRRFFPWRCRGPLPMLGVIVIGLIAYAYMNRSE